MTEKQYCTISTVLRVNEFLFCNQPARDKDRFYKKYMLKKYFKNYKNQKIDMKFLNTFFFNYNFFSSSLQKFNAMLCILRKKNEMDSFDRCHRGYDISIT